MALLLYFLSFINVLVVGLLLPALLGMIPVVQIAELGSACPRS